MPRGVRGLALDAQTGEQGIIVPLAVVVLIVLAVVAGEQQLTARALAEVLEVWPPLRADRDDTVAAGLPVWRLIGENWDKIKAAVDGARRTLTYNDFYYTNLAVARDGGSALMYDYGLLGAGYAYADVRNVCSALRGGAREAFLEEYGPVDGDEARLDAVVSVLNGLCSAYSRERAPAWAAGLLAELRGGLYGRVERLAGE